MLGAKSLYRDRQLPLVKGLGVLELIKTTTPVSWDGPARSSFF
jgi:hypothetical protein